MRLIQTDARFSLDAVKPLEPLQAYRRQALELTRAALRRSRRLRDRSPVSGQPLHPLGEVEGLAYGLCRESGSWFLSVLAEAEDWARLLSELNAVRHGPQSFHGGLAQSRTDHVYAPKLEWIEETLHLQDVRRPAVLEVATLPSSFTRLLQERPAFSRVQAVDEMQLAHGGTAEPQGGFQAAVMWESLDRVDDPAALLRAVGRRLDPQGLLFITGLVSSGFDFSVLGLRNLYLYPPDRTNVFSLQGLTDLLGKGGFAPVEVSTPGVLDLEVVQAHGARDPSLRLSAFELRLSRADEETRRSFQDFLQQRRLSSFARIVARKSR